MTTFYTLGARLSGMSAVVCAILAVLAYPSTARADEDCESYCMSQGYNLNTDIGMNQYLACVAECEANLQPGSGCSTSCSNGCVSSYPNCSGTNTTCTALGKQGCGDCKCKGGIAGPNCACQ